jgi:hypothetical protein
MDDKRIYRFGSNQIRMLLGLSLTVVGVLFLIGRTVSSWFDFDFGQYTWPLFIIIPGFLLFVASFGFQPRKGMTFAVIGGGVITTGLILLIQNTYDLYATWAYSWALVFPTSVGITRCLYGNVRGQEDQAKRGLTMAGIGLAIFVFGGFFFELVIGISDLRYGAAWLAWPGLLIGLGIVFLLSSLLPRRFFSSGGSNGDDQKE